MNEVYKQFEYGGLSYSYNEDTVFHVELGRYDNQYRLKEMFFAPLPAIAAYEKLSVSNGYKKRLSVVLHGKKTILAKQITLANLPKGQRTALTQGISA